MSLLPFDDRDGVIWFNGALMPWRDAKIHVLNHGLHYGSCVFEGVRVYNNKVFRLTEHSERLRQSGRVLGMDLPYTTEELDRATLQLLEANGIADGYIRPVAWLGSEVMGVSSQGARTHVAIAAWVWPTYFSMEARMKGLRLVTSSWRRPAPNTVPYRAKASGLYMICTLSKAEATEKGYDDALMLDWRGQVAESTGSNIFLVIDGRLHTPTPDCFLDGITRQTVIALAKRRGIEVIERAIMPQEFADAQEVFVTGTAAEVTPVGSIDDYMFTPGQITATLIADYEKEVGSSIAPASA
ncbi:branched-chain amino acid aminotransferase [Phaeovibrio sulfidiphilus]|uniref:Branched-chain-amino-acid aminotransferase n=1 Tax=Phaeovibrio sulfidiphilus TaxID=1220600 RepID=A0A8J6YJM3_9PROT|nr:branched-chain amino acid aminotransferase [Phaeovibrio sulfidiphilus]MBE1237581.1 branched-chain amino acid aminotransferase [Phaeovibrio sulfidiphilus]